MAKPTFEHWYAEAKSVAGMVEADDQFPQRDLVRTIGDMIAFDYEGSSGSSRQWPRELREPGNGWGAVSTLCAQTGDPWVNPSSGGLIGKAVMRTYLEDLAGEAWAASDGAADKWIQRMVGRYPRGFRRVGDALATNVTSLAWIYWTERVG